MPLTRRAFSTLCAGAAATAALPSTSGCRGDRDPAALRLLLNWFPEVEHGGYFAAEIHGYFAAEGLKVEIVSGRPDAPVVPQIAGDRAEFGVSDAAEILVARAQEAPIVAVFAAIQKSPRCVMVHASSGVERFEQLAELTLAMSIREPFAHFLQRRFGLGGATVVPYSGSVAPFLADPRLASQAYVFSEPLVARARGGDPRCLMVADAGFDPYASVLIASSSRIERDPALVEKMVRACRRGWEHYLREPGPANAEIARRNPDMDATLLEGGARALAPLYQPDGGRPIGSMSDTRWKTLAEQLVEIGVIDAGSIADGEGYTLQFLGADGASSP